MLLSLLALPRQYGCVNGLGDQARFKYPIDVTCVGHKVYVADSFNNSVRVVDGTTTEVMTTNGDGMMEVKAPRCITPHPILPHLIYICDSSNHHIRCLNVKDGTITTTAGTGQEQLINGDSTTAAFRHPDSMAFSPDGMHAIACDNNNTYPPHGCVRLMTMTRDGGVERVDLFVGSALEGGHRVGNAHNTRFEEMYGSATDSKGNYFVSDRGNHCILRITPSADVTLYCGSPGSDGWVDGERGTARFSCPYGLCFDGQDNLLVADSFNNSIRLVSAMDQSVTTLVGLGPSSLEEATLNWPQGVSVDGDGNVWVADTHNHVIRMVKGSAIKSKGVCPANTDRFLFDMRRERFEMFCVCRHDRAGQGSSAHMVVEDVMTLVWEAVVHTALSNEQ